MSNQHEPKENEYRGCPNCNFETFDNISECPNCKTTLQSESEIRSLGANDIVFAGMLTILCSGVLIVLTAFLFYSFNYAKPSTNARAIMEGKIAIGAAYFLIISLIGIGIIGVYAGRQAVRSGRRSRKKLKLISYVLIVVLAIVGLIQALMP